MTQIPKARVYLVWMIYCPRCHAQRELNRNVIPSTADIDQTIECPDCHTKYQPIYS